MYGEELTVDMLWNAYRQGWFPMTTEEEENEVEWFQPRRRCLMPIDGIHVSRSLAKAIRKGGFRISFNHAFIDVMKGCFRERGNNWLSDDFLRVYGEAHRLGWGHSAEIWIENELVGGVYGLQIGDIFCAESMFHRKTDMSKIILKFFVDACRQSGIKVFDAQIMNSHLTSLGGYSISTQAYEKLLTDHAGSDNRPLELALPSEYAHLQL